MHVIQLTVRGIVSVKVQNGKIDMWQIERSRIVIDDDLDTVQANVVAVIDDLETVGCAFVVAIVY